MVKAFGWGLWLGVMAEVKLMLRRRLGQYSMILYIHDKLINHLLSLMLLLFCPAGYPLQEKDSQPVGLGCGRHPPHHARERRHTGGHAGGV